MQYRPLGTTDLRVSVVGLGGWTMAGALGEGAHAAGWSGVDPQEAIRAVHAALDLGINFFDTADVYGAGRGEELLGQALKGRRHQAIIATKVGNVWTGQGMAWDASREHILSACAASLRRLQTDYIDLYFLHGGREEDDLEGVLEAFETLRQRGWIRHYGVSSHRRQVIERLAAGRLAAVQLNYNILEREVEAWHLPFCRARGIGVVVRGALARGLLTGKFTPETRFPPDDVRHRTFGDPDRFRALLAQVDRLRPLAVPGRTLGQAALQFVISHPAVSTAIPGARSAAQVAENAGAVAAPPLTPAERALIDAVSPPPGTAAPPAP